MKKYVILLFFLIISGLSIAQPPPPENAGTGNGPVGGGAPVGEDVTWLLTLAIGYAGLGFLIKTYRAGKEEKQQS